MSTIASRPPLKIPGSPWLLTNHLMQYGAHIPKTVYFISGAQRTSFFSCDQPVTLIDASRKGYRDRLPDTQLIFLSFIDRLPLRPMTDDVIKRCFCSQFANSSGFKQFLQASSSLAPSGILLICHVAASMFYMQCMLYSRWQFLFIRILVTSTCIRCYIKAHGVLRLLLETVFAGITIKDISSMLKFWLQAIEVH